jgi:TnsA endonuclease N terminal
MRRIPLSRRSHIVGFQAYSPGLIEHESTLERDFVTVTRFRDAAAVIFPQPITLSFLDGGQSRHYTPDYFVRWSNGTRELIEVKYRRDLKEQWKSLRAAFIAARSWAQEQGATFRIATDRSIRGPFLENAKRLLTLRGAPLDQRFADQLRSTLNALPDPTFGALAAAVPGERGAILGALWRMIARGELRADLTVPIGLHTPLRLP